MGRDLSVTIIGCGAMTADITWLLLAPGRAMRTRQNKAAPADLDYVALTHLHFDHAGNAKLFKDSGARLVGSYR
jgi:glyoxylase-like metal-dependent hydrolase (beta-lactamase superfamily II)